MTIELTDRVTWIALIGGLFAVLTFIHFVVDWIFQSHAQAMAKSTNANVRSVHCLIYTAGFLPLFIWGLRLPFFSVIIFSAALYLSHFYEDTYLPVLWWMKHLRKHPDLQGLTKVEEIDTFKGMFKDNLSVLLIITVDQIVHLAVLMLIAIVIVLT